MRGLLLLVVALGLSVVSLAAEAFAQSRTSVFVAGDTSRTLSAQKRRDLADSARDVRRQLLKRERLEQVEERDQAAIRVTILDRWIEVRRSGRNDWGGALSQTHYRSRYVLKVRFETDHVVETREIALAGAFVTWKRMAGVLADDVLELSLDPRPGQF